MPGMDLKPTRSHRPRLSIVIPTYNGWSLLERCLQTVMAHRPKSSEVIVVDDGSTDDTPDRVASQWPEVVLIRRPTNGGFCAAANHGLAIARGEIVEFLNNDTEVSAGWAEAPIAAFADPSVGSVAPLVCRLPHRGLIDSAGDVYAPIGMAKKRGEGRLADSAARLSADVFAACAAAAFYRRSAVQHVGKFPLHFRAYLDDIDLGFRLRTAGYRCLFEPRSRVFHWVSRSHRVRGWRVQEQVARNSEFVFWTNTERSDLLLWAAPHFAYVLIQLAYKAAKGDFAPWFTGKCRAISEVFAIWRDRRRTQSLAPRRVSAVAPRRPLELEWGR